MAEKDDWGTVEVPNTEDKVEYEIEEEVVDFNELKVVDRVKIVEQLPLELYEDITSFLSPVVKYEEGILTVNESIIPIDTSLLDATTSA